MNSQDRIREFFNRAPFAVVGASRDRSKFGNRVLRAYLAHGFPVYPVNPRESEVEGLRAYPDLASLPEPVRAISIVTPPEVTETIVEAAAAAGVEFLWMQPGAESAAALARAAELGLQTIAGGPCVLVELNAG